MELPDVWVQGEVRITCTRVRIVSSYLSLGKITWNWTLGGKSQAAWRVRDSSQSAFLEASLPECSQFLVTQLLVTATACFLVDMLLNLSNSDLVLGNLCSFLFSETGWHFNLFIFLSILLSRHMHLYTYFICLDRNTHKRCSHFN